MRVYWEAGGLSNKEVVVSIFDPSPGQQIFGVRCAIVCGSYYYFAWGLQRPTAITVQDAMWVGSDKKFEI